MLNTRARQSRQYEKRAPINVFSVQVMERCTGARRVAHFNECRTATSARTPRVCELNTHDAPETGEQSLQLLQRELSTKSGDI